VRYVARGSDSCVNDSAVAGAVRWWFCAIGDSPHDIHVLSNLVISPSRWLLALVAMSQRSMRGACETSARWHIPMCLKYVRRSLVFRRCTRQSAPFWVVASMVVLSSAYIPAKRERPFRRSIDVKLLRVDLTAGNLNSLTIFGKQISIFAFCRLAFVGRNNRQLRPRPNR
jgi:hypothetical protein